jgi:hypothetical protein
MQSAIASAQPPLGDEFEINSYTTGNQQRTAIAAGPAGDFVVAWSSQGSTGSDTSNYSIQARRYDTAGTAQGTELQVNTYTTNGQRRPSVGLDADGDFVVVGERREQRQHRAALRQRGHADWRGIPGEYHRSRFRPTVSMNGDGSFVSAWVGSTFGAGSSSPASSVSALPQTALRRREFQVNTLTTSNQWFPAVASPGGGIIVAFGSFAIAGTDTDRQSVQARLYDANGTPLGAEFRSTRLHQRRPSPSRRRRLRRLIIACTAPSARRTSTAARWRAPLYRGRDTAGRRFSDQYLHDGPPAISRRRDGSDGGFVVAGRA